MLAHYMASGQFSRAADNRQDRGPCPRNEDITSTYIIIQGLPMLQSAAGARAALWDTFTQFGRIEDLQHIKETPHIAHIGYQKFNDAWRAAHQPSVITMNSNPVRVSMAKSKYSFELWVPTQTNLPPENTTNINYSLSPSFLSGKQPEDTDTIHVNTTVTVFYATLRHTKQVICVIPTVHTEQ